MSTSLLPAFDVFIGIDQTGAALKGGMRARPLRCAILWKKTPRFDRKWVLQLEEESPGRAGQPLCLPSLSLASLRELLARQGVKSDLGRCAIFADCVFGLFEEVWSAQGGNQSEVPSARLWRILQGTRHRHGPSGEKFGRGVAEEYFATVLERCERREHWPKAYPRRDCEMISGANSIFQTRPFQKNIQTGTFRIWRDIAESSDERWLNFWPFETEKSALPGKPWIFEGYPTLFWKELLGQKNRSPARLAGLISKRWRDRIDRRGAGILKHDPDLADAAVLALGGWQLQESGTLWEPVPGWAKSPKRLSEGWIAGLRPRSPV